MPLSEEEIQGSLVIPKWFLYVSSILAIGFNVVFIPWAIWVTSMLFSIDSRTTAFTSMSIKLDNLGDKVSKMEGQMASHNRRGYNADSSNEN